KAKERILAGTLTVTTVPSAMVYVDDEPLGRSPITRRSVRAGDHTVQVRAQGYQPATSTIKVASGRTVALVVPLAAGAPGGPSAGADEAPEPPASAAGPPSAKAATTPPPSSLATSGVAKPSPPPASAPMRSSGPVVSVMPRSPIPKPTLPRDHFAEN